MKCPACFSDGYYPEGFCSRCGFMGPRTGADLDMARHFGVEILAGVKKIIPLTQALYIRGRLFFERRGVIE